eukprot:TRINITY_DN697_c0_g1_i1.p1 TRINITY_DN697_c0_g1~~TRINITY_DN697_c0_g1_i1.p1  ORF type:complete len:1471 (+),score=501.24 TRINITY_DN697_c0_g1_i1:97-4413(+)
MEVIMQKATGIPADAILSIKLGGTRRQAPVAAAGQPYRFAVSPAEPNKIQVELFAPIAAPQAVGFDPTKEGITVDFGKGRSIQLLHREYQDASLPKGPTAGEVAEQRGLANNDKAAAAKSAADYMDSHGLVKTFQDIIHGLLVSKPEDPFAYLEEHVARAKALELKKKGVDVPVAVPPVNLPAKPAEDAAAPLPPGVPEAPKAAPDAPNAPRKRGSIHPSSMEGKPKAAAPPDGLDLQFDDFLTKLEANRDSIMDIVAFLPDWLVDDISSDEFMDECEAEFDALDVDGSGALEPLELQPVIAELCGKRVKSGTIDLEKCKRFAKVFDRSQDGNIQKDEFVDFVQVLAVAQFLESSKNRHETATPAPPAESGSNGTRRRGSVTTDMKISEGEKSKSDKNFSDFLEMLEADKNAVIEIAPYLPDWLIDEIDSDEFLDTCEAKFLELDVDKSGALEAAELVPIIADLCTAHPTTIDLDKCKRFVKVFDRSGDGVIQETEFFDFAQFLVIANYLATGAEAAGPASRAKRGSKKRGTVTSDMKIQDTPAKNDKSYEDWLKMLEADKDAIIEIVPFLPEWLVDQICSDEFMDDCDAKFLELDADGSGVLEPTELTPVIAQLCEANPTQIDLAKCERFVKIFDVSNDGVIEQDEFVNFAQFLVVANYLACNDPEELPSISPAGAKSRKRGSIQAVDPSMFAEPPSPGSAATKFDEFIQKLEADREAIMDIVPYLPADMVDVLCSDEFLDECEAKFFDLDTDKSGGLDPVELIPVVATFCTARNMVIDVDKSSRFMTVFDRNGDGVIKEDEFIDFCQFLVVMTFLTGQVPEEGAGQIEPVDSSVGKVSSLMDILKKGRKNIELVLPYLPQEMKEALTNEAFFDECFAKFDELDKDQNGSLNQSELVPVIVDLSAAQRHQISNAEAIQFVGFFDQDCDSVIDRGEFCELVQFVILCYYLDSIEGHLVLEHAKEETKFDEFLMILESDRSRMSDIIPLLEPEFVDLILSDKFEREVNAAFKELDVDKSGVLEPNEVVPIVQSVADKIGRGLAAVDTDKCKRFIELFDTNKDGVVQVSELLEMTRFLMVMTHLTEKARTSNKRRNSTGMRRRPSTHSDQLMEMLQRGKKNIPLVMPFLPDEIREGICNGEFGEECVNSFKELDKDNSGTLTVEELIPLIVDLSEARNFTISPLTAKSFIQFFDQDKNGTIDMLEFYELVQFVILCYFLESEDGKNLVKVAKAEETQFDDFVKLLEEDRDRLMDIVPYLPEDLVASITSQEFYNTTIAAFENLDLDKSGALEANEVIPILMELTQSQFVNVDEEKARRFIKVFDRNGDGVIQDTELVELSQFLIVMDFLTTQEKDRKAEAAPPAALPDTTSQISAGPAFASSPQAVKHLQVDVDFYKTKASKLEQENEDLRRKARELEDLQRKLESTLEGVQLRCAHLDM